MRFCSDLDLATIKALAIGGFDGIHIGHKSLIDLLGFDGALLAIESYNNDLTPDCIRAKFIKQNVIILPLDSVRNFDDQEFISYLKSSFINLQKIIIGYDFRFGKNRAYDITDLINSFDGEVVVVDEVKLDGESVHSTLIRSLIRSGEIKKTTRFLGHKYMIKGEIISGQGLGMRRLFPTLNLEVRKFLIPSEGVYATYTKVAENIFRSVSFIGHRISTDGTFAIETHILDENFSASLLESVEIYFVDRIRKNRKFSNLDELKNAIQNDINRAKTILEKEQF